MFVPSTLKQKVIANLGWIWSRSPVSKSFFGGNETGPQVLCLNNRKAPGMMGFHPRVSQERFISVSKVNPSLSGCGLTGLIMMVPTFWIWANSNIFVLIWVRGPRSRERGKQKVEFFLWTEMLVVGHCGEYGMVYVYIYMYSERGETCVFAKLRWWHIGSAQKFQPKLGGLDGQLNYRGSLRFFCWVLVGKWDVEKGMQKNSTFKCLWVSLATGGTYVWRYLLLVTFCGHGELDIS